jgi:hypothetical protein
MQVMNTLAISYFKRYKMEIDLAGLAQPTWPAGFEACPWRSELFETHVDTLAGCFQGGLDTAVFPSLGSVDGCRALMAEIVRRPAFIPEATWLLVGPGGPCGTIQALRERGVLGAIQNVGILPAWRGRGLGRALLLQSLKGMWQSGLGRAILEVTGQNETAIQLYLRMGFRRTKVLYKAVPATSSTPTRVSEDSIQYV